MNEGHAALLSLELLEAEAAKAGRTTIQAEDIEKVRCKCVFTTHTPVPAGHDRFPMEYLTRAFPTQTGTLRSERHFAADLVKRVLQTEQAFPDLQQAARTGASLNMTYLALSLSKFVNGVAKQHGETSRQMFPGVHIEAITNGVHAGTGRRRRFGNSSTATSRRGGKTTTVCEARWGCRPRKSGPRT